MALKRECDSCGRQEDHAKTDMVAVELPAIRDGMGALQGPMKVDLCGECLRRVRKAAAPQPRAEIAHAG